MIWKTNQPYLESASPSKVGAGEKVTITLSGGVFPAQDSMSVKFIDGANLIDGTIESVDLETDHKNTASVSVEFAAAGTYSVVMIRGSDNKQTDESVEIEVT